MNTNSNTRNKIKIIRIDDSNIEDKEEEIDLLKLIAQCIAQIKTIDEELIQVTMKVRYNSFENSSVNTFQTRIELANAGFSCLKKEELKRECYVCSSCKACFYQLDDDLIGQHKKWFPNCAIQTENDDYLKLICADYLSDISNKDSNYIKSRMKLSPNFLRCITECLRKLEAYDYDDRFNIDPEFSECISNTELYGNFIPITTDGDGNCLYKSIALLIYGNQEFYSQIKLCILFIFFEYEDYFKNLLSVTLPDNSFEKLIEDVALIGSWGNEYTQLAASILFNRPLHTYSFNENYELITCYQFCVNDLQLNKKPMNLVHKVHHFVGLLPTSDSNFTCKYEKLNQFIDNFSLDHVTTYN